MLTHLQLHPTDSMTEDPNEQRSSGMGGGTLGNQPGASRRKESIVEKVKDALHMKK